MLHVVGGLHGVGIHKQRATLAASIKRFACRLTSGTVIRTPFFRVTLINATLKNLQRLSGVIGHKGFLHTDGQRHLRMPTHNITYSALKRHAGSCTAALHIDHAHAFRKQTIAYQWRKTHLSPYVALPPTAHTAIAKPRLLNLFTIKQARIGQQFAINLSGQIFKAAAWTLAEGGASDANNKCIGHQFFPG